MIFPVKVCDGKEKCSKRQSFYLENKGGFFFVFLFFQKKMARSMLQTHRKMVRKSLDRDHALHPEGWARAQASRRPASLFFPS